MTDDPYAGLVDHLLAACPEDVETQLLAFDVAMRKRLVEPALVALEEAVKVATGDHSGVMQRLLPFAYAANKGTCTWKIFTKGGAPAAMALTDAQKVCLLGGGVATGAHWVSLRAGALGRAD